jgi:uncharacterized membrane protein YoaK (UPF0700 family)
MKASMATASDETTNSRGILAIALALIAGYIDSYSLLTYKVYASFMSGNTTQSGLNAGQGRLAEAAHQLVPIPLFVIGVFCGTFLLAGLPRHPTRLLCGLASVFLAASFATTYLVTGVAWPVVVLLSFAMGVMNTCITHVGGQSVSLGFVTGDLNYIGRNLALAARGIPPQHSRAPWDTHWRRAGILARIWSSFLIGAVMGGAGMLFAGAWVLLPPIVILSVLALCAIDVRDAMSGQPLP